MYPSIHPSIYLFIHLFIYLSIYLCASRHNGVHFFNIRTSKSGANMWCFVHFDFEMCFAPQRRALFRHLNLQKWSEHGVFCTFWLRNVLRATMACTFSTSQLPKVVRDRQFLTLLTWKCASHHNGVHFFDIATSKVVRTPGALHILTSKCASRHNGVQFFIAPLASWLRTRRFSEPTFRPSGATNHWKKHSVSRLSYLFAQLYLLSSYSFSSDLLSSNLPLLSASSLLCFSSVHIVGNLTSKFPSINPRVLPVSFIFRSFLHHFLSLLSHFPALSLYFSSMFTVSSWFAPSIRSGFLHFPRGFPWFVPSIRSVFVRFPGLFVRFPLIVITFSCGFIVFSNTSSWSLRPPKRRT